MRVLETLKAGLDEVCGMDPSVLADGESMVELHRQLARFEACVTRAVAAFDAAGEWRGSGARSAGGWISVRCGMAKSAASARVRLGRDLRHLPVAEAAWLAGEIGGAQVGVLARARTPAPPRPWRPARRRWSSRPRNCATTSSCGW